MDNYEVVEHLGAGSFGVAKLCRHKHTQELLAIKFIERGPQIDEYVTREIINHRSLRHPNVIGFKEVVLTPTHLGLVMEYAAGGELFQRICDHGRLTENEARFFFQQLIVGVNYCHSMEICHRDLKLDNILLDGSEAPRLKICDFGFSKSSLLHSKPKTTVGSPTYAAPEVLAKKGQYDGKLADVWSCGVTLYIMLVAAYPFEDPNDHKNFRKTLTRIMDAQYEIPDDLQISQDCHHLLSRIFVADPSRRISVKEIKSHPWFLKNLPTELTESALAIYYQRDNPIFSLQSVDEIMKVMEEARNPPPASTTIQFCFWGSDDEEDEEEEVEEEEEGEEEEEE